MFFPPFRLDLHRLRYFSAAVSIAVVSLCLSIAALAQEDDGGDDVAIAVASFNKGQELHEKGDLDGAVKAYSEAIKLIPEFPEAEFQLATAYKQLGKDDLAERSFRRAVELREDWSLALAGLGAFLVDKDKLTEAEPLLKKAIELDEQNFPAFSAMAELKIRANAPSTELRGLLSKITILSSKAKPPVSIWTARGSLERSLGDTKGAKLSFARTLEAEPENRFAMTELALIALAEGDATGANELIKKLEAKWPGDKSIIILKARSLLAEGKNAEADTLLGSITEPNNEVKDLKGKIAAVSSTDKVALEKQAAEDPKNVIAPTRLCSLYRIEDPRRALEFCRRASELEPDNISHAVGYGAALVQAKEYPNAVLLLRKLLTIAPDNSTVHANLATALFQSKRYAEAKPEYQWLAAKQPKLAVTFYFLGIVHDHLLEYLDAAANYQEFLKLVDPKVNQLEIEKVNLRMPTLLKQIKDKKGK
jgi:tetratricopeptide (TPR) repeat protein